MNIINYAYMYDVCICAFVQAFALVVNTCTATIAILFCYPNIRLVQYTRAH